MKNSAKKKGAKKKAAAIKKAAKKNRLVSKKISKVSGRKRPSVRKKPLINYDERRCTHVDPDTGEICGDITHPTGRRKIDGVQIRMKDLCTKHHQEDVAKRNGKKNYGTVIANNAGFESMAGYVNSTHPYRKYRKDYCENIDGRLGFKCTATITEDMIKAGVLEVDHIIPKTKWERLKAEGIVTSDVNSEENTQTLCSNCHTMKGWLYEDSNPKSDRYMLLETA